MSKYRADNFSRKISVIVPVYNAELYLADCLDSIVSQDYFNMEIILIDDGSEDGSYSICKKYAEKDDRIVLVRQENKGLVCARRIGIRMAQGDYISFVDADDYIENDMYTRLLDAIGDNCPDIAAFGLVEEYADHTGKKKNHFPANYYNRHSLEKEIFPLMLSYQPFFDFGILPNLVCKLINRRFLNGSKLRVSNQVTIGEDADVTFQLMVQARTLQIVDIYPYHYCKRDDSMMHKEISISAIDALECDLKMSFLEENFYDLMKRQLDDYIIFLKLLKNPGSIETINAFFSNPANRIALYGAGGFGQALYREYSDQILLWADKNYEACCKSGMEVRPTAELIKRQNEYDYIYISILDSNVCRRMKDTFIKKGIRKKILFFTNSSMT